MMKSLLDGWEMTEEQERRCVEAIRRNDTLAHRLMAHANDTPRKYFTGAEFEERMRVKSKPIVYAWAPRFADGPGHKKDT